MPAQNERRLEGRLDRIAERIEGLQLLHVKTTFEIYERIDNKPTVVETRDDLDLLIDPVRKTRRLRHEATDVDKWDELAADAKLIPVTITLYREQLEALLCKAEVIGILSGQRAGKTHVVGWWMFRQWMLRGGLLHSFWWVAPQREMTQIGVDKLFRGEEGVPPIFPPQLVISFPKNERQQVQAAFLIDGSYISFKHAHGDGDNLKGRAPYDIAIDELTAIRDRTNYSICHGRLTTHGGQIATASTPKAGHWSHGDIVQMARRSDLVAHFEINCFQNPWNDPEVLKRKIEVAGGEDDPLVQRDFYGKWVIDGAMLWSCFDTSKHLVIHPEITTIAGLVKEGYLPEGYVDVTARISGRHWRSLKNKPTVLAGQDFNVWPCSTLIARAYGDPHDQSTWGLFFFEEFLTRGAIQDHAEKLRERWPGIPISCDATGDMPGHGTASQGITGPNTNVLELQRHGFEALPCNHYRGKPKNPLQVSTINLCHRLYNAKAGPRILVSTNCNKTVESIYTQEREVDGRIKKESSTLSDRRSGPTDCKRYLTWSLFRDEYRNAAA